MTRSGGILDIDEGHARSTLQMIQQAIRNNWKIPQVVRDQLPAVVASCLTSKAKGIRLRAAEAIMMMDRDNLDALFRLLKVENDAAALGLNASKADDMRGEIEEVIMVRVRQLRREQFGTETLDAVVNAGLARLGLPPGTASGDGADAARPGDQVRD